MASLSRVHSLPMNAMPIEIAFRTRLLARIPVLPGLLWNRLKRIGGMADSHDAAHGRGGGRSDAATGATPRHGSSTVVQTGGAPTTLLAPMDPDRLRDARHSLRRILDCHPAAPAIWPSIALVERSMRRHGGIGIERLSSQVLQDAARVLNRLMDELCEHGIVVLLERIDRVLRIVHGCAIPADVAWQAVRPAEIQVLESTITEFMEIERAWEAQQAADEERAPRAIAA